VDGCQDRSKGVSCPRTCVLLLTSFFWSLQEAASGTAQDQAVKAILDLFAKQGKADYVGESISQLEHALQVGSLCNACAQREEA
jgi:hypothetical protein